MRFRTLGIAGFRGVRDPMDIVFPSGFVVLSGRNGTGKSSICDAIEFALTGSLTKYSESSETGEDVNDYLWWRGSHPAEQKYVTLELVDSAGETTIITRRPDGLTVSNGADVRALLCDRSVDAEKTLDDICRTSIIRDELITQLSVDLAEPDRFAFVRAAVGSSSFAATEGKLSGARKIVDARIKGTRLEYERARDRVKDLVTELSKAQAEATKGDDAANAEAELRVLTGNPNADMAGLLASGRKLAPEMRLRIDALDRLVPRAEKLLKQEAEAAGDVLRERQNQLLKVVEERSLSLASIRRQISEAEILLRQQQEIDLLSLSLAQLHEHGSRVGLSDGHCPLCGSAVSEADFRSHLAELESRLERTAEAARQLTRRRAEFNDSEARASAELSVAQRQADQISTTLESVNRERAALGEEAKRLGMADDVISQTSVALFRLESEASRVRLAKIEKYTAVLDASTAHSRVAELQKDLAASQQVVVATEKRVTKLETADQQIKRAADTLKRVSSEIVDDRLAAIRPLLGELYVRLRPHVDWPEISYLIRGDTRRFLSLRVGGGLNLRFMFSSGQRRAAGLAFLMAVSLSRPWCLLETLIFDDPVQHIDDFRALHLVESLSALRQVGRQIICTVEDSALAELLARRLRSSETDEGALIEMDYESGRGSFVGKVSEILPFSTPILRYA